MLRLCPMLRLWMSLILLGISSPAGHAAQLIMTDQRGCVYCAEFGREVVPVYGQTELGRAVPLRQIDARVPWPDDLRHIVRPRATPIFILVDKGKEIGRWAGYVSREDFFAKLGRLAARL